jgi:hypothetical protein
LNGYDVNYDDNEKEVLRYLDNHLDREEVETIFDHARYKGEAYFQDREGHHFIVEYKSGEYFLEKR